MGSRIIVAVIFDKGSHLMPKHAGSAYHINPAGAIDTKGRPGSTGREWEAARNSTPGFNGSSTISGGWRARSIIAAANSSPLRTPGRRLKRWGSRPMRRMR